MHILSPGRPGRAPALLVSAATLLFPTPYHNVRTTTSCHPARFVIRRFAPKAAALLQRPSCGAAWAPKRLRMNQSFFKKEAWKSH